MKVSIHTDELNETKLSERYEALKRLVANEYSCLSDDEYLESVTKIVLLEMRRSL